MPTYSASINVSGLRYPVDDGMAAGFYTFRKVRAPGESEARRKAEAAILEDGSLSEILASGTPVVDVEELVRLNFLGGFVIRVPEHLLFYGEDDEDDEGDEGDEGEG